MMSDEKHPNVRRTDPETSYEAAEAIAPKISSLHRRIIAILDLAGEYGATPYELIRETGVIYNTIWRRLSELKSMGIVTNTDARRPNDRGFNETVVILTSVQDIPE